MLRPLLAFLARALLLPVNAAFAAEAWNVGTWKTAQTIQPFYYQRYAPPNVEVKVHPFTNPGDQKAALLAGSLEMTGTTLVTAIQAGSRGEPVVVVASLGNKCSALVVASNGGITEVAGLKGKKIGYVPGTMHEILLRETLFRAGLDPRKDVTLIRVDFFDMGTALQKGDIDAYLSGEPLPTQAVMRGYGRILAYPYFDDSIGTINSAMIVRNDMIAKNPEKIQAMVRAHKEATVALMADRQSWIHDASGMFGVDLAVLTKSADNIDLVWDMDDAFVRQVAALGKRMNELGMIQSEPDYAALIDRRFVRALAQ